MSHGRSLQLSTRLVLDFCCAGSAQPALGSAWPGPGRQQMLPSEFPQIHYGPPAGQPSQAGSADLAGCFPVIHPSPASQPSPGLSRKEERRQTQVGVRGLESRPCCLGFSRTWNREFSAQNGLGWGPVTGRIRDKLAVVRAAPPHRPPS